MFGISRPGAHAYREVSVDTDALAANPHQLIVMLFDGALRAMDTAGAQMACGDIEGKGRSITRAIDIVGSGLAASLDLKQGGELASRLASLYDYIIRQLVAANIGNDTHKLADTRRLLGQMRQNWIDMGGTAAPHGVAA